MELLKQMYEIHSPSGKEQHLSKFIRGYVQTRMPDVIIREDEAKNLYFTKGISKTYPCLVAHLDQVQHRRSKDFRVIETEDILFGYSGARRGMEGLGADDKNGIWIALKCLLQYDVLKVAFFVGEEVGCYGSHVADMTFFKDCRYVIEPDRHGKKDLITNISWSTMCSKKFFTDIHADKFGYKQAAGLMTDILALQNNGLAVSAINISCGYYDAHTDHEFTVKEDLLNCLACVRHIIETCTEVYPHIGISPGFCRSAYSIDDTLYRIMQAHPDYTAEDIWKVFQTNFPDYTEREFLDMFEDYCALFKSDKRIKNKRNKPTHSIYGGSALSKRICSTCYPIDYSQNSNNKNHQDHENHHKF